MSGGNVAYHLRPNKAIDRYVFVDLLTRLHGHRSIRDYTYIGFGGPFLEDFRLIHAQFGLTKMTSLECDKIVLERQRFNKPLTCVTCLHQTSAEFISSYSEKVEGNAIVWLDYARPRDTRVQLQEFQTLITKLREFDVLKLTLNATPDALYSPSGSASSERPEDTTTICQKRFDVLSERIGEFIPNDVTPSLMNRRDLPHVICRAAIRAAKAAARGMGDEIFLPLTAFSYADSLHTMTTISGIIISYSSRRKFLQQTGIGRWALRLKPDERPIAIDVPALSTRERLFVDALLPRCAGSIARRLRYQVDDNRRRSADMLHSYALFYRHYPYFSRIVP